MRIGDTISHFRILERLGAGGMGEVYKAEDTRLRRPVALKLMLASAAQGEQARRRFLREAQAASALSHPNIATIYEADEVERDGARYNFIAMEYVAGRTLGAAGTIPVEEAVWVTRQLADALALAHGRGIVHRDIKPANIMISEWNRPVILDFGVAKYLSSPLGGPTEVLSPEEALKTAPGTVVGTYAYMSPEQALAREVDARSDIFSLGIVFYELLAGRPPFHGNSAFAVVDAILHAGPPALSGASREISPELERIVRRMLEKEPARRYQSMREVCAELDALPQGARAPADAGPGVSYETAIGAPPPVSYETNVVAPSPLPPSGSGLRAPTGLDERRIAVMTFSNVTRNEADDWIGTGIAETVTSDLKNIRGVTVIGREHIYEALRRLSPTQQSELDEKVAALVGHEVGARWMICGGYQRIGEALRITARGVEVATGEVVRTVKIDGQLGDIFELQDRIVRELSQHFDLSLHTAERELIARKETQVVEAYEAFTKGYMEVFIASRASLAQAIAHLERALALDPGYARAHVWLGFALNREAQYLDRPELFERSLASLRRGIELAPESAEGYTGLALTLVAMGRGDEAIEVLRRAGEAAATDAFALLALGRAYFVGKGQFREAAAEFDRALELDPKLGWAALQLAECCAYLGEYERGEAAARAAITSQEENVAARGGMRILGAYVRLGHIHELRGRNDDAIAEYYRELVFLRQTDHGFKDRVAIETHQRLASVYRRQGSDEEARRAFAEAAKGFEERLDAGADDDFTRYYMACAYAAMGDADRALESLGWAARARPHFTAARARLNPDFEGLRGDPRFQAILARG